MQNSPISCLKFWVKINNKLKKSFRVYSNKIHLFKLFCDDSQIYFHLSADRSHIWHVSNFLEKCENKHFLKAWNSESGTLNSTNLFSVIRGHFYLHYIQNLSLDSQYFWKYVVFKLDIFFTFKNSPGPVVWHWIYIVTLCIEEKSWHISKLKNILLNCNIETSYLYLYNVISKYMWFFYLIHLANNSQKVVTSDTMHMQTP